MFGFSLAEVAVILTVALIVLGPEKLPQVARSLAKVYGYLARLRAEFTKAIDDNLQPINKPLDLAKWPETIDSPSSKLQDDSGQKPSPGRDSEEAQALDQTPSSRP